MTSPFRRALVSFLRPEYTHPKCGPLEVYIIRAESPETVIERLHHALPVVAAGVGVAVLCAGRVFCCKHYFLPFIPDEPPRYLLACNVCVNVGGIDEVPARLTP